MPWARKERVALGGQQAARALSTEARYPADLAEALRKAKKMSFADCISWADTSLAVIGRNISDHYQSPATGDHLREAAHNAAALYAVLTAAVQGMPVPVDNGPVRPSADLGVAALRQG